MSEPVLYEKDGHVAIVTMNRPENRNAVTDSELCDALIGACRRAAEDPHLRCVILTGNGPAFSSGGNLKHMRDGVGTFAGSAAEIREGYRRGIQRLVLAVWELEIPVVAAVNGPAYGAGCDLTLACDVRIAAERAVFAENFVRVGLISGDGGSWLLPRAVGLSRAAEMTFTADPVDAATALAWGLVSRVVPEAELVEAAKVLAARIAANPPRQLRMAKRLLREGQRVDLPTLLELAAAFQGALHHTADHREAVASLLDKREAVFKGD
jgi:enoyl-CoA hydratase/carnithine racemase